MPELNKTQIEKLNNERVDKLKGKLLEIRRAGASPIFIEVAQRDNIEKAFEKADIPTSDDEMKIEGVLEGQTKWTAAKLSDRAIRYKKLVVTTKVQGSTQ
jgi:hypothetical protein